VTRYRATRADPAAYRPPPGLTIAERAEEQDTAAGGRATRLITRDDGTRVIGSVALRCYRNSRRVYAYLRWTALNGKTAERYLGDVSDCPDRDSALRRAWEVASHSNRSASTTLHPTGT
jgi:DNA mismatch endonuclease (patch repair protein)